MSINQYVFIHVPKTAGISFWHAFRQIFGAECVSSHILDSHISESEAENLRKRRVVSGHLSYDDLERFFSDRIWMTVLREPVDRALSQYFHYRTIAHPDQPESKLALQYSIDEYFFLPPALLPQSLLGAFSNRSVHQLGAHVRNLAFDLDAALERAKETLKRCRWVGLYERLPRLIEAMRSAEPDFSKFTLPQEHATPGRLGVNEISEAVRSRILELNAYDLELYEWAKSELVGDS